MQLWVSYEVLFNLFNQAAILASRSNVTIERKKNDSQKVWLKKGDLSFGTWKNQI